MRCRHLKVLIKKHNAKGGSVLKPIRLDFEDEEDREPKNNNIGGKSDDELQKPFKEASLSPFTRRIIEFFGPKHVMPTNLKLYDGSMDPDDHHSRFAGVANQGKWQMPVWCRMFH